ncbi:MAG: hypothetical protein K2I45_04085 [Muribaculaceae bacterium]|nr:hypothetical protein [Muribaculaceae bacterium]
MKPRHILPLIAMLLSALAFSCGSGSGYADVFTEAEKRIAEDPDSATSYLDSLAADTAWTKAMRESDRARFTLLRVKAADKAYVRHTSDSLIRTALAYYENHTGSEHYPEALYYGGRVYSDLGDSPSALPYYQTALYNLPENEDNKRLRTNILVQTAYIMDRMRLYDEAIPLIQENIELCRELKDSSHLADDLQFLGAMYMHEEKYDTAVKFFRESKEMLDGKNDRLSAKSDMYIAAIYYKQKKYVEALQVIRGLPERISGTYHPQALTYAAEIYLNNGINDTAYMYADSIIKYPASNNRHIGYKILLKAPLRNLIPKDSLEVYYERYASLVNENLDRNADRLALIQASVYNYSMHQREKEAAVSEKEKFRTILIVISLLAGACIILILYLKYTNKRQMLDLVIATRQIDYLRSELTASARICHNQPRCIEAHPLSEQEVLSSSREEPAEIRDENEAIAVRDSNPREVFVNKLLLLLEDKTELKPLPAAVLNSELYRILKNKIREKDAIPHKSELWQELEQLVDANFPQFNKNLKTLTKGTLLQSEYRLAMLVKCGFSPRDLTYLLSISKGGVSARRTRFGIKFFDRKLSTDEVDRLIRSF